MQSVKHWFLYFLVLVLVVDGWIARLLYQRWRTRRFDSEIVAAARRYDLDPAIVKAVIWRESEFNPKAHGRAGEIGLMQIRELAAREWAQAEKLVQFTPDQLIDPGTNTLAGTWYLKKLIQRYGETDFPLVYALADYNAGRTHVLRWNQGAAKTNNARFLEQMDYPGTRKYIRAVVARREEYHQQFKQRQP